MTRISLDEHEEAVQRFFLSLPKDRDGSVVELKGRAVARIYSETPSSGDSCDQPAPWTEAKNARRCALTDKEIAGNLSPEEAQELEQLQGEMLHYRRQVAPLPLEDARRLHQELLAKALAQAGNS